MWGACILFSTFGSNISIRPTSYLFNCISKSVITMIQNSKLIKSNWHVERYIKPAKKNPFAVKFLELPIPWLKQIMTHNIVLNICLMGVLLSGSKYKWILKRITSNYLNRAQINFESSILTEQINLGWARRGT